MTAMIVTGIYFSACNNTEKKTVKHIETIVEGPAVIKNDTMQVQTTIRDFLKWYKTNYKKANALPILGRDSADYFAVNSAAYTDYLSLINSSNYVSSRYLEYWKVYFQDKELQVKADRIKTGTPEGFDFDFVLITQNPEYLLNRIDSIQYDIISISDSATMVGVKLPKNESSDYEFEMYKEKAGWKIGYISTPNYD